MEPVNVPGSGGLFSPERKTKSVAADNPPAVFTSRHAPDLSVICPDKRALMDACFRSGLKLGIDTGIKLSHQYAVNKFEEAEKFTPAYQLLGLTYETATNPNDWQEKLTQLSQNLETWKRGVNRNIDNYGIPQTHIMDKNISHIVNDYPDLFKEIPSRPFTLDEGNEVQLGASNTLVLNDGAALAYPGAYVYRQNGDQQVITWDSPENNTRRNRAVDLSNDVESQEHTLNDEQAQLNASQAPLALAYPIQNNGAAPNNHQQVTPHKPIIIGGGDGNMSNPARLPKTSDLKNYKVPGFQRHQLDLMHNGTPPNRRGPPSAVHIPPQGEFLEYEPEYQDGYQLLQNNTIKVTRDPVMPVGVSGITGSVETFAQPQGQDEDEVVTYDNAPILGELTYQPPVFGEGLSFSDGPVFNVRTPPGFRSRQTEAQPQQPPLRIPPGFPSRGTQAGVNQGQGFASTFCPTFDIVGFPENGTYYGDPQAPSSDGESGPEITTGLSMRSENFQGTGNQNVEPVNTTTATDETTEGDVAHEDTSFVVVEEIDILPALEFHTTPADCTTDEAPERCNSPDSIFGDFTDDIIDEASTESQPMPAQAPMAFPDLTLPATSVVDDLEADLEAAFTTVEPEGSELESRAEPRPEPAPVAMAFPDLTQANFQADRGAAQDSESQEAISESANSKSGQAKSKKTAGTTNAKPSKPRARKPSVRKPRKKKGNVIILDPITCPEGQLWYQALGVKLDVVKRTEQECLSQLNVKIDEYQLDGGVRAIATKQLREAWVAAVAEKKRKEEEKRLQRIEKQRLDAEAAMEHVAAQSASVEKSYMDRVLGPDCEERRFMEQHGLTYKELTGFNMYMGIHNNELRRKNLVWSKLTAEAQKDSQVVARWEQIGKVLPLAFVKKYATHPSFRTTVDTLSHRLVSGGTVRDSTLLEFFKTL
jgi:hypothetical protein